MDADESSAAESQPGGEEEEPRIDTDRKGCRSADIPVRHLHPDGSEQVTASLVLDALAA
jgi:hypothetical protein